MRLKSEIWVKAYLRRCHAAGVDAVLVRRGDADAGAIYIKASRLDGTATLFGPAPAGFDPEASDRLFAPLLPPSQDKESDCDQYLERQLSYDPDVWIVVVEDKAGQHFLDDWLMRP